MVLIIEAYKQTVFSSVSPLKTHTVYDIEKLIFVQVNEVNKESGLWSGSVGLWMFNFSDPVNEISTSISSTKG